MTLGSGKGRRDRRGASGDEGQHLGHGGGSASGAALPPVGPRPGGLGGGGFGSSRCGDRRLTAGDALGRPADSVMARTASLGRRLLGEEDAAIPQRVIGVDGVVASGAELAEARRPLLAAPSAGPPGSREPPALLAAPEDENRRRKTARHRRREAQRRRCPGSCRTRRGRRHGAEELYG